jgi:hypothetical protein
MVIPHCTSGDCYRCLVLCLAILRLPHGMSYRCRCSVVYSAAFLTLIVPQTGLLLRSTSRHSLVSTLSPSRRFLALCLMGVRRRRSYLYSCPKGGRHFTLLPFSSVAWLARCRRWHEVLSSLGILRGGNSAPALTSPVVPN